MSRPWLLKIIPLFLLAAACSNGAPAEATPTQFSATSLPQESPSPIPSPTPTSPPGLAWLVAPPETSLAQAADIEAALTELSEQSSLLFEKRAAISSADLNDTVRIVVVLPPDPGLVELAAAFPQTQFLAVAIPGLVASGNLSVIGPQGERPDQQGFLAGYLTAVISQDWRVGVISRGDTPSGLAARLAFTNGVVFFCGLCRPAYPPFYQYPIFVDLTTGTSQSQQQAAADILIGSAVKTAYVFSSADDTSLLEYLGGAGVNLVGGITPPTGLESHWAATIQPDPVSALRQLWPELISAKGGLSIELPLTLSHINPDLFSPGRQLLVAKTLADLLAGYIGTGVDPLTGQPR